MSPILLILVQFQRQMIRCFLLCVLVVLSVLPRTAHAGWPKPASESASGDPEVLFTFDDGPHEKHTRKILDTLHEFDVQAIFFWTGHRILNKHHGLEDRIALVERAVQDGQLVGNHTTTHAKLCTVDKRKAARELDENAKRFEDLSGLPMLLLRIPYGAKCRRLETMLAERGVEHLHWDLDPQEFRHRSEKITFSYVTKRLRRLKPGNRVVLLMHDTQPATAKALPKILRWIDQENEKRARRNKRPIRIVSGSQHVEERHPVPLLRWTQASLEDGANALIAALLLPSKPN